MPTIDRKPPELPSLVAVAASLAREGRGAEAQAVKNAAELLARSACDGDGEHPDTARLDAIQNGDVDVDCMGTSHRYFNAHGINGQSASHIDIRSAIDAAISAKGAGE
jgi:hypothetical protein